MKTILRIYSKGGGLSWDPSKGFGGSSLVASAPLSLKFICFKIIFSERNKKNQRRKVMVSITFTTGPLSGQSHQVEKNDPIKFLLNIVQQKWDWKLDFCLSNETEIFIWTRADMVARIIRALIQGRSIIFDGQIFSLENNPYIKELIENIEDTIVQSGYNVYVAKDDENGVLIEIAGTENPIQ